jgi:hypothetical protein
MFLVSKVQEARIRRQERKRFQKILRDFALKVQKGEEKRYRDTGVRFLKLGFAEGFETGRCDPGLSREGFYTKAMTFANKEVDSIIKRSKK